MSDKDNDKTATFFLLHDGDVVDRKVGEVIHNLFFASDNPNSSSNCRRFFEHMLREDSHSGDNTLMYHIANELHRQDFYNPLAKVLSEIIRMHVREAMTHGLPEVIERRMKDLSEMERRMVYRGYPR